MWFGGESGPSERHSKDLRDTSEENPAPKELRIRFGVTSDVGNFEHPLEIPAILWSPIDEQSNRNQRGVFKCASRSISDKNSFGIHTSFKNEDGDKLSRINIEK